MSFRLIVSDAPDLTTIQVAGRLRDDAVTLLGDTCERAGRPLVLDLSGLTSASDAGVLLLQRLMRDGVRMLGASQYMRLLLEGGAVNAPGTPAPRRPRGPVAPVIPVSARPGRRRQRP